MARESKSLQPTQLELLILKVLWRVDVDELPITVREIRKGLAELGRELAHTSVITTLNIMVDKKFLDRSKRKNAFLFSPRVAQDQVNSRVIGDMLNRVFDGSAQTLMLALMDHDDVDSDDLIEIRKMINRKTRKQ